MENEIMNELSNFDGQKEATKVGQIERELNQLFDEQENTEKLINTLGLRIQPILSITDILEEEDILEEQVGNSIPLANTLCGYKEKQKRINKKLNNILTCIEL